MYCSLSSGERENWQNPTIGIVGSGGFLGLAVLYRFSEPTTRVVGWSGQLVAGLRSNKALAPYGGRAI